MNELIIAYGYLGAFIVCVIGNASIIFPIPFALLVYAFGSVLNPLLLGVVCGVGSAIGEMSSYIVGRGGRRIVEGRFGNRLDTVERLVEKHGMLVVFLVALLPIPDDLLLIPLGMMKYSVKKTMIAMLLGKTLMCLFLAYAGAYSVAYLRDFYASGGEIGVVVAIIILAVIIIVLLKVDWGNFVNKQLK
jgi:uncharacterized membrane protein YdjX (TVP38/TMEM64 family)